MNNIDNNIGNAYDVNAPYEMNEEYDENIIDNMSNVGGFNYVNNVDNMNHVYNLNNVDNMNYIYDTNNINNVNYLSKENKVIYYDQQNYQLLPQNNIKQNQIHYYNNELHNKLFNKINNPSNQQNKYNVGYYTPNVDTLYRKTIRSNTSKTSNNGKSFLDLKINGNEEKINSLSESNTNNENKSLYEQAKGYFQKNNAKSNNVIEPALTKDYIMYFFQNVREENRILVDNFANALDQRIEKFFNLQEKSNEALIQGIKEANAELLNNISGKSGNIPMTKKK